MTIVDQLNGLLIGLIVVLGTNYVIKAYFKYHRDVHELYVQDQSVVETTRLPHESPIYKSNKLDHNSGLRIGLDIRYDHYKIRHGNLNDIWTIISSGNSTENGITINNEFRSFSKLNHQIKLVCEFFNQQIKNVHTIRINQRLFLINLEVLVFIFSAFINQITVEFYDSSKVFNINDHDEGIWWLVDDEELLNITSTNYINIHDQTIYKPLSKDELITHKYDYSSSKDKGVAVRIIGRTLSGNPNMTTTVEFTQLNLISAIASSLKHLPESKALSSKDTVMIIQEIDSSKFSSSTGLISDLVRILASLTAKASVEIYNHKEPTLTWKELFGLGVTVLSISTANKHLTLDTILKENSILNPIYRFTRYFRLQSLKSGRFPGNNGFQSLRLIYLHSPITQPVKYTLYELNEFRSETSSRIIREFYHYSLSGPVIQSEFYDYRQFQLPIGCKGCGCLSQALDIKLVDINEKNKIGNVVVRGYTIGKTTNKFINENSYDGSNNNTSIPNNNDGFMPLTNVKGKWGNDGCLYIF